MLVNKCLLVVLIVFAIIGALGIFSAALCFLVSKFLEWRRGYYAKKLVIHRLQGDLVSTEGVEFIEDDEDDEDDESEEGEEELVEEESDIEYGEDELAPLDVILKKYKK